MTHPQQPEREMEREGRLGATQIWPFGHGCLMTAVGEEEMAGNLFLLALPDQNIGKPGDAGVPATWAEVVDMDGPRCTLNFADIEAVERLIATLGQVKDAMTRGGHLSQGSK